jgi:hypothetical protein
MIQVEEGEVEGKELMVNSANKHRRWMNQAQALGDFGGQIGRPMEKDQIALEERFQQDYVGCVIEHHHASCISSGVS